MNFNLKLIICALMLTTGWYGCSIFVSFAPRNRDRDVVAVTEVLPLRNNRSFASAASSVETSDTIRDKKLEQLLSRSIGKTKYESSTKEEIARFEKLLLHTLAQRDTVPELEKQWSIEGWELIHWTNEGYSFIAICEQEQELRGRGFYVVRINSNSNLVLQAPHRFYDMGSGTIVSKLFQEYDCQAAAWNTVHRKQFDFAHCRDSFLNAFTALSLISTTNQLSCRFTGLKMTSRKALHALRN